MMSLYSRATYLPTGNCSETCSIRRSRSFDHSSRSASADCSLSFLALEICVICARGEWVLPFTLTPTLSLRERGRRLVFTPVCTPLPPLRIDHLPNWKMKTGQVPQRASSAATRGVPRWLRRARPSSVPPWSAGACSGKRPRPPSRAAPPVRRLSASRRS